MITEHNLPHSHALRRLQEFKEARLAVLAELPRQEPTWGHFHPFNGGTLPEEIDKAVSEFNTKYTGLAVARRVFVNPADGDPGTQAVDVEAKDCVPSHWIWVGN